MVAGVKWGAIVGVAVYLALLGSNALLNVLLAQTGSGASVTEHPILLVPLCLSLFLLIFAFSAAGFYTGRETGMAGLGALAGVVTLVVQYVLGLIGSALAGINASSAPAAAQQSGNPIAQVLASIMAAVLVLGLAASIGWLGGRPGAARSPRRKLQAATAASSTPPEPHM
jgi:hypothetical protein